MIWTDTVQCPITDAGLLHLSQREVSVIPSWSGGRDRIIPLLMWMALSQKYEFWQKPWSVLHVSFIQKSNHILQFWCTWYAQFIFFFFSHNISFHSISTNSSSEQKLGWQIPHFNQITSKKFFTRFSVFHHFHLIHRPVLSYYKAAGNSQAAISGAFCYFRCFCHILRVC